jgi:hypothetical protein
MINHKFESNSSHCVIYVLKYCIVRTYEAKSMTFCHHFLKLQSNKRRLIRDRGNWWDSVGEQSHGSEYGTDTFMLACSLSWKSRQTWTLFVTPIFPDIAVTVRIGNVVADPEHQWVCFGDMANATRDWDWVIFKAVEISAVRYCIRDDRRPVRFVRSKSRNETVDRLEWPHVQIQTHLGDLSITICDLIKRIIRPLCCIATGSYTGQTEDPAARITDKDYQPFSPHIRMGANLLIVLVLQLVHVILRTKWLHNITGSEMSICWPAHLCDWSGMVDPINPSALQSVVSFSYRW